MAMEFSEASRNLIDYVEYISGSYYFQEISLAYPTFPSHLTQIFIKNC